MSLKFRFFFGGEGMAITRLTYPPEKVKVKVVKVLK